MKILLSGASGFIGQALCDHLTREGHTLGKLSRRAKGNQPHWDIEAGVIALGDFTDADAVIHLAGEPIATGRWTAQKKERILRSRQQGTALLARTLAALETKPRVLISGSAIGFYGARGDELMDEDSSAGSGFLADVCQQWEQACQPARDAGIRVVNSRFGVVLSPEGGALAAMLLPFKLGLGGPVGDGHQFFSWISLQDVARALSFLLTAETVAGPVNLTAPDSVRQREFAKALGHALQRPAILPAPVFALRLLLGPEKAQHMLLDSTRVYPTRLLEAGFVFSDPEVGPALKQLLRSEG